MSDLVKISSIALYTAFIVYLLATLFFGATIKDRRTADTSKRNIAGNIGITLTILGFLAQLVYFITRWVAGGHAPVSNMFEFVTFLGMSLVLGFIIIYFYYRLNVLGLFRSEEHTSELQSRGQLVCRLLLEKKKKLATTVER